MAKRYHINAEGKPGLCKAARSCPFGDFEADHYATGEEARAAYEARQGGSFSEPLRSESSSSTPKVYETYGTPQERIQANIDARVNTSLTNLAALNSKEQDKYMSRKLENVETAFANYEMTIPGTPERAAAVEKRQEAREALVGADIAVLRNSDFYSPDIEDTMKTRAMNVGLADLALEEAQADMKGMILTGKEYGVHSSDVRAVLETVHRDYIRPRSGVARSLGELSENEMYVQGIANQFKMSNEAVSGIIKSADIYDVEKRPALV